MKIIGMFFANKDDTIEAYRKHSQSANNSASDFGTVIVNPKEMTITFDDWQYRYYTFNQESDVMRICGIRFDAVFSEVIDPYCKWYIMTRFRPGQNK